MSENDARIPKPDFSRVMSNAAEPAGARGAAGGAKPDFSNVQGGSSSTAVPRPAAIEQRLYTVKAGDSLSLIARREYGKASLWKRIFEANRDTIENPDLIHPGQVIKLPGNPEGNRA